MSTAGKEKIMLNYISMVVNKDGTFEGFVRGRHMTEIRQKSRAIGCVQFGILAIESEYRNVRRC